MSAATWVIVAVLAVGWLALMHLYVSLAQAAKRGDEEQRRLWVEYMREKEGEDG